MTFRRFFAGCVILLMGVLGPAWPAAARQDAPKPQLSFPDPLSDDIVRALNLTPEQVAQVKDAAKRLGAILEQVSPGDAAFKRAREAVLRPLNDAQASVAFRNEFSAALMPALGGLAPPAKPEGDIKAINALRIAGSLATPAAVDLLDRCANHDRIAVRYAAVNGLARVFEALRVGNPAIPVDRANAIVRSLNDRLLAEDDALVLDACVRSLIAAMETAQRPPFGDLLPAAYSGLAKAVGERLGKFQGGAGAEPVLTAVLRAGLAVRNGFIKGGGLPKGNEPLIDAAALDGRILAYLVRRLAADFPAGVNRSLPSQMATVAETTILLANQSLGGGQLAARGLGDLIRDGKDQEFIAAAQWYIGPGGLLTKPPFNIQADKLK